MQIKGLVDKIDSRIKDAVVSWMYRVGFNKVKDCLKSKDAEALCRLMSSRPREDHVRLCSYMVQLIVSVGDFQFATSLLEYQLNHFLTHNIENLYLEEITVKSRDIYHINKCHFNKFYETKLLNSCLMQNSTIDKFIVDINNKMRDDEIIDYYRRQYQITIKSIERV